jgi:hypothetical protein
MPEIVHTESEETTDTEPQAASFERFRKLVEATKAKEEPAHTELGGDAHAEEGLCTCDSCFDRAYEAFDRFFNAACRFHGFLAEGETWLSLKGPAYLGRLSRLAELEVKYLAAAWTLVDDPLGEFPLTHEYEDVEAGEERLKRIIDDLDFLARNSTLDFSHRTWPTCRIENHKVIYALRQRNFPGVMEDPEDGGDTDDA